MAATPPPILSLHSAAPREDTVAAAEAPALQALVRPLGEWLLKPVVGQRQSGHAQAARRLRNRSKGQRQKR